MHLITPDIIVETAKKWIGTPFHPQGRAIGIGVDCLGLVIEIAKSLSIKSKQGGELIAYDQKDYNLIHPNAELVIDNLNHHLEAAIQPSFKPGLVIGFINHKRYVHLGIVADDSTFIHACMMHNKVLEERIPHLPHRTKLWRFYGANLSS